MAGVCLVTAEDCVATVALEERLGTGVVELTRGEWSRRISDDDRLIGMVHEHWVVVISQ